MTRPAAGGRHTSQVWGLHYKARLWRWERIDEEEERERRKEAKHGRYARTVDFTCCARNNEFFAPLWELMWWRNSQRGPVALRETSGIRSMLAGGKTSYSPTFQWHSPFAHWQVSDKPLFEILLISNGDSRNKHSLVHFSSLKCVHNFWIRIKRCQAASYPYHRDVLCSPQIGSAITQLRHRHRMRWVLDHTVLLSSHSQWWQYHNTDIYKPVNNMARTILLCPAISYQSVVYLSRQCDDLHWVYVAFGPLLTLEAFLWEGRGSWASWRWHSADGERQEVCEWL